MTSLPIADEVRDAAVHGSFCPKLCNYACPVVDATGREDATPWSFHRAVSDMALGRREPDADIAHQLRGCTGCLACQGACDFDQDVPEQVRAGRASVVATGTADPAVATAVAAVAAGRSPFGIDLVAGDAVIPHGATAILPGCRESATTVAALRTLLEAAGEQVAVASPDGCCGGALDDLGARDEATTAATALRGRLEGAATVVALDPHCEPSVRGDGGPRVLDVATYLRELLDAGRLSFDGETAAVTYHDPCLSARRDGVIDPPRALLAAAGVEVTDPEGSGAHTVCSGSGMAADLLAPDDAVAVAAQRAALLQRAGPVTVTACAGAAARLRSSGVEVHDLVTLLAARLSTTTTAPESL